jgi:fructokinase
VKVLGFGAVLWDNIGGQLNIGGAVFNLTAHAKKLGAEAYFITAIGKDELGDRTFDIIKANGVRTPFIKRVDVPTCIVNVTVQEKGVPLYEIPAFTSWDLSQVNKDGLDLINKIEFDYFCFGTIEQRNPVSQKSLRSILENCTFHHVFYDMNLRLHYYDKKTIEYSMEICNILKMNDDETETVKTLFGYNEDDYTKLAPRLRNDFNIDIICITEGAKGAYISSNDGFDFCPGYTVEVADTVGSGDAFSAGLIYKHNQQSSKKDACDFACKLGAFVASRRGAVPDYIVSDIDAYIGFQSSED